MPSDVWHEITYLFPHFNDCATGVDNSFHLAFRQHLRDQFIIQRGIDYCDYSSYMTSRVMGIYIRYKDEDV